MEEHVVRYKFSCIRKQRKEVSPVLKEVGRNCLLKNSVVEPERAVPLWLGTERQVCAIFSS